MAIIGVDCQVADAYVSGKRPHVGPSPASHVPGVKREAIGFICVDVTGPEPIFELEPNFHVVIERRECVVITQISIPRLVVGLDANIWEAKTNAILKHVYEELSVDLFVIRPVAVSVDIKPDAVGPSTFMHSDRDRDLLHLVFGRKTGDTRDQLQVNVAALVRVSSCSERLYGFVISQTIAYIDATRDSAMWKLFTRLQIKDIVNAIPVVNARTRAIS